MDIHKPKPWHGVREFLKEYAIIVVGVLTALGAEQGVEWLHWRHEIQLAREALAFDMRRGLAWSGEKDADSPCAGRSLAELSRVLDQAQQTHRLPPVAYRGPPGGRSWVMRGWASLVSGQTLAHMSAKDQHAYSGVALSMESMARWREAQAQEWAALSTMAGPGRPIDQAEITSLRMALFQAYLRARQMRTGARNTATLIVRTGLLSPAEVQDAYQQGVASAAGRPICGPLPAVRGPTDLLQDALQGPVLPPGRQLEDELGVHSGAGDEREAVGDGHPQT